MCMYTRMCVRVWAAAQVQGSVGQWAMVFRVTWSATTLANMARGGRKCCHKCPLLLNSCNAVHKKLTKLMTFFFNLYFILNCIKSSNRGGGGEIWGRGVQPQICWASNYHDSREETGEISVTIPFISCSKFNTIAPLLLFPRPSLITLFPPVSSPAFLPWQEEESFLSLAVPF